MVWVCFIQLESRFKNVDHVGLRQEEFGSRPFEIGAFIESRSYRKNGLWWILNIYVLINDEVWFLGFFFCFGFFFAHCAGPNY